MELTAQKVSDVFMDCLFLPSEVPADKEAFVKSGGAINAQGIVTDVFFHPKRLESHKQEIRELLNELPDSFHEKTGGGMSFLNACYDKHGHHWGEHRNMEQLFLLGQALGIVEYCLPKEMWRMLPGGMPYLTIKAEVT